MTSLKKMDTIFWYALRLGGIAGMGIFLIFLSEVGGITHGAFAAGEAGLSVSPLTFELTGDKGDTIMNELRVFNPTPSRFSVVMNVEDFTATGELGAVVVEHHEDETHSFKEWVVFDPPAFSLDPGGKQFVRFSIVIPDNAEPGGYYGSILAAISAASGEGSGTGVSARVGALVLLSVSGEVKEELFVEEFETPDFQEHGPVPFSIRFVNTGTVHVRPIGFVQISNLFGRTVEDVALPQKNIIPGATRLLEFAWSPKGFTVGRYTASLVGNYGQTNTPVFAVTEFWVVPWKQLAAGGFILFVILGIVIKMRKRLALAFGILFEREKA